MFGPFSGNKSRERTRPPTAQRSDREDDGICVLKWHCSPIPNTLRNPPPPNKNSSPSLSLTLPLRMLKIRGGAEWRKGRFQYRSLSTLSESFRLPGDWESLSFAICTAISVSAFWIFLQPFAVLWSLPVEEGTKFSVLLLEGGSWNEGRWRWDSSLFDPCPLLCSHAALLKVVAGQPSELTSLWFNKNGTFSH